MAMCELFIANGVEVFRHGLNIHSIAYLVERLTAQEYSAISVCLGLAHDGDCAEIY